MDKQDALKMLQSAASEIDNPAQSARWTHLIAVFENVSTAEWNAAVTATDSQVEHSAAETTR